MKKLAFEYGARETSLQVVQLDNQWWFSLEDLAKILGIADTKCFVSKTSSFDRQVIDEVVLCNFKELCRRLGRCHKAGASLVLDWFFEEVLPKLRELEIEEPFSPITAHLEHLESQIKQNQSNLDTGLELMAQNLANLSSEVSKSQTLRELTPAQPSNGSNYITQLREQQQYNSEIIENFIRSLENPLPPDNGTELDHFFWESEKVNLVANDSNGNR